MYILQVAIRCITPEPTPGRLYKPINSEGIRHFISYGNAPRTQKACHEKIEDWKKVTMDYFTKLTYFGGIKRSYPLLMSHPVTGEDIFRYHEVWNSKLQSFELSSKSLPQKEFQELISQLQAAVYDDRCFVSHDWHQGDMLLVENHYMLHGRAPISDLTDDRELWRVQLLSDSSKK